jgi:hypothetical protein
VVEYNTSTNPVEDGLVQDTSGRGLDGAFYGDASYDATEKALVFDGNADNISGTIPGVSGEYVHSITLWVKINDALTYTLFEMGARSTDDLIGISISSSTINHYFYSNDNSYTGITPGSWHHLTFTYSGGSDLSNRKLYINGNEVSRTAHGGGSTGALTLANGNFTIGDIVGGAGSNDFKGSISNFKLYDTALTAQEVKTLYDMGRCDEGHHMVNFSKTRVGIGLGDGEAAQAALDVRGNFYLNNNLVVGRYVGFSVYRSASTTGLSSTVPVPWNAVWATSEEFTGAGSTDTSGLYRLPYTGAYMYSIYGISTVALAWTLRLNSSKAAGGAVTRQVPYNDGGANTWNAVAGSGVIRASAGQYISICASNNIYGNSGSPHNGFAVTFLGA